MVQKSRISPVFVGLLVLLIAALFLPACGAPKASAQERIHFYLYNHNPSSPEAGIAFVRWANTEMADYTTREIYDGINDEAKSQARSGHPNAVAALSYMARSYAKAKKFSYNEDDWVALQEQAIENIKESGPIDLF